MFERVVPASLVRRSLAVFIDFLVAFGVWVGAGVALRGAWWLLILFVLDVIVTATWGSSPGRWICGIRIVRVADGEAPGVRAALVRTALVFTTGWLGVVAVAIAAHVHHNPGERMWWDAAAGTRLVSLRRVSVEEALRSEPTR